MHSMLPTMKKSEEYHWLKECPSQVLQQKCQDLDTALKNKFKHKNGLNDRNQRLLDMKNGGGDQMVSDAGSSEQEAQLPCAVG